MKHNKETVCFSMKAGCPSYYNLLILKKYFKGFCENPVAILIQLSAEFIIGLQKSSTLRCQRRAAAVFSAGSGGQKLKPQRVFGILHNGPRFGISHLHLSRCSAQRMKPLHTVQQLRNAGTEALRISKQTAG